MIEVSSLAKCDPLTKSTKYTTDNRTFAVG